jgi:type I restriction enzyme S subunit
MSTNQWCKWLIPSEHIHYKYLYYYLLVSTEYLNELWTWVTFKEISWEKIKSISIPLPPIKIQEEIVAQVWAMKDEIRDLKQSAVELRESAEKKFEEEIFN